MEEELKRKYLILTLLPFIYFILILLFIILGTNEFFQYSPISVNLPILVAIQAPGIILFLVLLILYIKALISNEKISIPWRIFWIYFFINCNFVAFLIYYLVYLKGKVVQPTISEEEIIKKIKLEINKNEEFDNWHGINKDNLSEYLVEPYRVNVYHYDYKNDEVDTESFMEMWVVLHEIKNDPHNGYLIAYDPLPKYGRLWNLISYTDGYFVYIYWADSFANCLTDM